jgi:phage gp29-like protein
MGQALPPRQQKYLLSPSQTNSTLVLHPEKPAAPESPRRAEEGQVSDIPARIASFSEWDSVYSVQAALLQLENGMFQSAALLADAILRDDRVIAVMDTFIDGVLGLPFHLEPAGGEKATARAKKICELVGDDWPAMLPRPELRRWIVNGEMLGLGVGELIWTKTDSKWTPRLKVHHNQFVIFDWSERVYRLITQDGPVNLVPRDSHWALYLPGGYQYGWMHSLTRSIWMQWMIRQFAYRDWARYSEVHGLPIRGAIMPAEATPEERKAFLLDVARVGSETAIALKQAHDGDKFDLKLIEAVANSHESFDKLVQRAEESIAIRALGQNLSTQIRGGSFAAAQVHENVRQDRKEGLAVNIQTDIKAQILKPYVEYNSGDVSLTPDPTYNTQPPADRKAVADSAKTVSEALLNFKAAGIAVDVPKICKSADIPLMANWKLPEPEPTEPQAGKKTKTE